MHPEGNVNAPVGLVAFHAFHEVLLGTHDRLPRVVAVGIGRDVVHVVDRGLLRHPRDHMGLHVPRVRVVLDKLRDPTPTG